MGDGTVWISEDDEWDEHDDTFLTGTFSGYHDTGKMAEELEGLPVVAAEADPPIAWTVTAWVAPDSNLDRARDEGSDSAYFVGRSAYRMRFTEPAPTGRQAQALVSERLALPAGWVAEYEVAPA